MLNLRPHPLLTSAKPPRISEITQTNGERERKKKLTSNDLQVARRVFPCGPEMTVLYTIETQMVGDLHKYCANFLYVHTVPVLYLSQASS